MKLALVAASLISLQASIVMAQDLLVSCQIGHASWYSRSESIYFEVSSHPLDKALVNVVEKNSKGDVVETHTSYRPNWDDYGWFAISPTFNTKEQRYVTERSIGVKKAIQANGSTQIETKIQECYDYNSDCQDVDAQVRCQMAQPLPQKRLVSCQIGDTSRYPQETTSAVEVYEIPNNSDLVRIVEKDLRGNQVRTYTFYAPLWKELGLIGLEDAFNDQGQYVQRMIKFDVASETAEIIETYDVDLASATIDAKVSCKLD